MIVLRMCTIIVLVIALYDDLKERKIRIIPVIIMMIFGTILNVFVMRTRWTIVANGCIPGGVSFLISKFGNECIGKGDCLLVLCMGILYGCSFCLRFLLLSCISIFFFSCIMLLRGKVHRKSQVPCVPFMMIGYIGAWLL